ncbi:unnamed protein product [Enterobius vermicularis]|uniref:DNA-directed RNA polymerase III subunit RPC8 n=1 Tax=Enterobius vermicularis TaxID=51028 RepID=A0A0N4VPH4_ENTVE|nr:unnamed protein product [Enterobius vermicularis]
MFVLVLMEDVVRIKPHQMGQDVEEVVTARLNELLSNKVIPGVGLCIFLHDILELGDGYILPGDGSSHVRVKFRFIVFRPFVDEIIEAKVLSSNKNGLTLTIKFFEEIFIPAHRLPQTSVFEEEEQASLFIGLTHPFRNYTLPLTRSFALEALAFRGSVWYWEYVSDDDQPPAKLYMDPGKVVKFRVVENLDPMDVDPSAAQEENKKEKSFEIIGSMAELGLGCVAWWTSDEDACAEAEDEGEAS